MANSVKGFEGLDGVVLHCWQGFECISQVRGCRNRTSGTINVSPVKLLLLAITILFDSLINSLMALVSLAFLANSVGGLPFH